VSKEVLRRKDRLILYFTRLMSLFYPRLIHSPAHQSYTLIGIALLSLYVCANTPASSLLPFSRSVFTTSRYFPPSQPPAHLIPCDVILCI